MDRRFVAGIEMDWSVLSLVLGGVASLASLLELLLSKRSLHSLRPRFDQAIVVDVRSSTADQAKGVALSERVAKAVRQALEAVPSTAARQQLVVSSGDGFVIALFDAVPTAALDVAVAIRNRLGQEAASVAIAVERSPLARIGTWGVASPLLRLASTVARTGEAGLWLSERYLEKAQADEGWGSREVSEKVLTAGEGPAEAHAYRALRSEGAV